MNKIGKYLLIPLLLFVAISCQEDTFSEEELLALTTQSNYTVRVVEEGSYDPVEGARVTIFLHDSVSATTDVGGNAYFTNIEQGSFVVNVQKEGFFEVSETVEISTYGREETETQTLYLFSEANSAIIEGVAKLQIDLTTEEYEYPVGAEVIAYDNSLVVASSIIDESGKFKLMIPTRVNGRYISLGFPDLQYDQKVAVREDDTVLTKTASGTIFSLYSESEKLPNTANILVEVQNPPYSYDSRSRQAYVKSIDVTSGTITGVEMGDVGSYYTWDAQIYVTSPDGGSGANIRIDNIYDWTKCWPFYYALDPNNLSIFDGGTGYPDYEPNLNVSTEHPSGFTWSSTNCASELRHSHRISSGEVVSLNVNYGTGAVSGEIK